MIKLAKKMRPIKKPLLDKCIGFGPVELYNGYEEHNTPYGKGISYEDIFGMSFAALLAKINHCDCFTESEKRNAASMLEEHCNGWVELE